VYGPIWELINSTSSPGATVTGKREEKEIKKGNVLAYREEHNTSKGRGGERRG
jgi:hypothetical protein